METKPLERFATQARRDLLAAVDAQATTILAPGSVARSERASAVVKLEKEIAAHGRYHVIDKVAYTWFNRIVALRFMDACGYTAAGVVSPAQGQMHGQPEILADAKRGNLDAEVFTVKNEAEAIIGLLDGSRRSTDAEGEAYALLLTEYCRYWHKSMPFMFEREGDYTELLVPTGLLADGAILTCVREVLTAEVCEDVEVIGWLYQFYTSERKQQIFDSKAKRGADEIPAATQLFTPHWIVRYLVENSLGRLWMLNRPASRLIDQMRYYISPVEEDTDFLRISTPEELTIIDPACGSGHMLTYAFDLLYSIYEEEGYAPADIPSLILTRNLFGAEIDMRAGVLAAFALAMKARARQRTFFSKQIEPKICVIEPISFGPEELDFLATRDGDRHDEETFWNQFEHADILGALIQPDPVLTRRLGKYVIPLDSGGDLLVEDALGRAEQVIHQAKFLSTQYCVSVANPPYMGSKYMEDILASYVKDRYPDGKQDLYGCFVLRSLEMVVTGGYIAKVIGDTWMSIVSFENFRRDILAGHSFDSFVHLRDVSNHPDIFGANAAFVLAKTDAPGRKAPFIRLTPLNSDEKRIAFLDAINDPSSERRFVASALDFVRVPGAPISYWLGLELMAVLGEAEKFETIADVRQGLSPADKPRFMRAWWEVSFERTTLGSSAVMKWYPYNKGGGFRKWFGNVEHVVNWQDQGAEIRAYPKSVVRNPSYYLRESITWTKVSSGRPSFRHVPAGYMFDGAAGALFPHIQGDLFALLAVLNSSVIEDVLAAYAPTLNFTEGNIASLPVPRQIDSERLREIAEELVSISKYDWDSNETSLEFLGPLSLTSQHRLIEAAFEEVRQSASSRVQKIRESEVEIDRTVASSFGLREWRVAAPKDLSDVGLRNNPFASPGQSGSENFDLTVQLVSYAIGCMFGRYSLSKPGLILADQGSTLQTHRASVSSETFVPDADNVIPIVDDGWFEDDIVERFREFLRVVFGSEHFEANLRFVEESLGVKTLRDYFINRAGKSKFYDDHVQKYKKRPIYWMFSSPSGSFNALIYLHRYNPSTVSTVLNEYLREYRAKLEVALTNAEQAAAGGASAKDQKEADRLRKVLAELRDYEHDVLYPLATQQITIDLDDGVKTNYPKFYPALKKITGLEAAE
ncbi:BREX-1 system adenine-specific DNA-methyltransferase PglX [Specibacter sp. AOP5-B1-6]|uniref:BREX-1 system adenine-specific DNA-methyltransferase PglX n=1 Tax=Specibacter sp. AOP5-B1-6 TaxID=3457653 RepID=UPI00402B3243